MFVPLRDAGVDARGLDSNGDRGFLRMFAVHHDGAAEFREVASRRSEEVPDFERDLRTRPIDFESLAALALGHHRDCDQEKQAAFHDGSLSWWMYLPKNRW